MGCGGLAVLLGLDLRVGLLEGAAQDVMAVGGGVASGAYRGEGEAMLVVGHSGGAGGGAVCDGRLRRVALDVVLGALGELLSGGVDALRLFGDAVVGVVGERRGPVQAARVEDRGRGAAGGVDGVDIDAVRRWPRTAS